MTRSYQAVNTLVLVSDAFKAEEIAAQLRKAGIAIQQQWVSTSADFTAALQREAFDLAIIYANPQKTDIPAAIFRYPDTPFVVMLPQYRNRLAEELLELGVTDVVGFSHPVRMQKVLRRIIVEAKARTEHRRIEQQLRVQGDMLETLLTGTQESIAFLHQGMHSYSNPAYQRLTGLLSSEEVLSTPLLDLISPSDQPAIDLALRQIESGQQDEKSVHCYMLTRDGKRLPVTLRLTRSWYDDENVVQLMVSQRLAGQPAGARSPTMTSALPSANTLELLKTAGLRLNLEPINCLRADIYDRQWLRVSHTRGPVESAAELLQDDHSGMTLIDLDRSIILEAMNQLTARLKRNPNSQFLIPLHADATCHHGLTQWLQQHMQTRSIPARAITLVMPLTASGATFAEQFELTRQMRLAGIGVCVQGISGSSEEQLYLSTTDIDYAILGAQDLPVPDDQPLNRENFQLLSEQIRICRQAKVKTMIKARHPTDIAQLWKLGLDCFIGDPEAISACELDVTAV